VADHGFRIVSDTLRPGLESFDNRLDHAVDATMHFMAPRVEAYGKLNAPWTDRTSNARNGLFAEPGGIGREHWIDFAHSVSYGIWLEVRFGGRYQIILPTIQTMGRETMTTLRGLLTRMGL
jgi:hypothetical protein